MSNLFSQGDNVRYIIDEEKRTVVCLIQRTALATGNIVNKYLQASNLDPTYGVDENLFCTFRGIAKCHPEDKWDSKVGCELARSRAEAHANMTVNKSLSAYVKSLRHAADLIEEYGLRDL